jgi:hypothetical protein
MISIIKDFTMYKIHIFTMDDPTSTYSQGVAGGKTAMLP